jgi:hypothetical protein
LSLAHPLSPPHSCSNQSSQLLHVSNNQRRTLKQISDAFSSPSATPFSFQPPSFGCPQQHDSSIHSDHRTINTTNNNAPQPCARCRSSLGAADSIGCQCRGLEDTIHLPVRVYAVPTASRAKTDQLPARVPATIDLGDITQQRTSC